jgi:hypothetical protein
MFAILLRLVLGGDEFIKNFVNFEILVVYFRLFKNR